MANILLRRGNMVEIAKDNIEIDCFATEDVSPF